MGVIVVNGVDGNFGREVAEMVQRLLPPQRLLFTAPRKEALAEWADTGIATAVCDFNDPDGLAEVFAHAEKVLLVSMPFVGVKRRAAHKNVVDAMVAAGAGQLVYTSLCNASDPTNPSVEKIDHAWTESYAHAAGLDYVFLRNSQYLEAMVTIYLASAEAGVLANNAGEGRMAFISRRDCARAAAHVLANRRLHREILDINGAQAMTMAELVAVGNEVTGNTVVYQATTDEENYAIFDAMGVPRTTDGEFLDGSAAPFSSEGMVTFGAAIREGKMALCTDDFREVTGITPITVREAFENAEQFQIGDRHAVDA